MIRIIVIKCVKFTFVINNSSDNSVMFFLLSEDRVKKKKKNKVNSIKIVVVSNGIFLYSAINIVQ